MGASNPSDNMSVLALSRMFNLGMGGHKRHDSVFVFCDVQDLQKIFSLILFQ